MGRHQLPFVELSAERGGNARVGLEDNIYLDKGVLAEGSAPLVARCASAAARFCGDEITAIEKAKAAIAKARSLPAI